MKFAKTVDIIITVIYFIALVFFIYIGFSAFYASEVVREGTEGAVNSVSSITGEGPGDGYLVVGGVSFIGLGILASAAAAFLGILMFVFAFFTMIFCVIFVSNLRKHSKTMIPLYINENLKIKMILGIIIFVLVFLNFGGKSLSPTGMVCFVIQVSIIVFTIISRYKISDVVNAYRLSMMNKKNAYQMNNQMYANNQNYYNPDMNQNNQGLYKGYFRNDNNINS